jgi:oxygen tolerance protein BatD
LVTPSLLVLLALQAGGGPLDVAARVDRARVALGEEIELTVRARAPTADPISLELPPLGDFLVLGTRELTDVSVGGAGGPVRTTVRELQLRATKAGTLLIGAVRARQGRVVVATDPIVVTVDSGAAGRPPVLTPLARAVVEAAPPPDRTDRVALTVVVRTDTVLAGEQLDVVAAAWFPRELRGRLHRPPLVTLTTPQGVWAYPAARPSDVAVSRPVRGTWMDLFVAHQVVFPLAAGRVVIPPASVEYAVPTTFSFFSREERYALESDSVAITVLPLPAEGRPSDDQRVAGLALTLALDVQPTEARVGEPLEVTTAVSGVGNVALWPEPALRWPVGFRPYPAEPEARIEWLGGRVSGSKVFRYLVVPDSAGTVALPELRYPYYDLGRGAYVVARAAPRALAVAAGAEPRAARALPPLELAGPEAWAGALARDLLPWGWGALLCGPPLAALLWRRRSRPHGAAEPVPAVARQLTRLGRLEREFSVVLANHVPDPVARDGDGLARALRATGLESAVADHIVRLRDRLRAARYGPHGLGDATEVAAEIEQVLRVLEAEPHGRRIRLFAPVCLAALLVSRGGLAQGPSAEALYAVGALRAAADSFAARAGAEPRIAAHWYNLGATLYRSGADGRAAAAWAIAARLAPRDRTIQRARELLPAPDAPSERLLAVGAGTPAEWGLAAAVCWIVFWAALARQRRPRALLLGLAVSVAAAAAQTGREALRRRQPLAVVVNPRTPVLVAPYGGASAVATLEAGAALLVERRQGGWLEVARGDGVRGWLLEREAVRLPQRAL